MPLGSKYREGESVGDGSGGFSKSSPGRLLGFIASHAQTTAQAVIFNNFAAGGSGDVLLYVYVAPERCPLVLFFPADKPLYYDALSITATNCAVYVWTADQ